MVNDLGSDTLNGDKNRTVNVEGSSNWGSGLDMDESVLSNNSFLQHPTAIDKNKRKRRVSHVGRTSGLRRSLRLSQRIEDPPSNAPNVEEQDAHDKPDNSSADELYAFSDDDGDNVNIDDEMLHAYTVSSKECDEQSGDDSDLSNCGDEISDKQGDESDSEIEEDPMKGLLNREAFVIPVGEKFKIQQGMLFENVDAYRRVLYEYSILWGCTLNKFKNEKTRVTASCDAEGCEWRAHASVMPDKITFAVKTCNPDHTCIANTKMQATVKWMAEKIEGLVRADSDVSIHVIRESLLKYGVHPSDLQLFRARNLAKDNIGGSHSESYTLLPKYCRMVMLNNPRNVAKIEYCTVESDTTPHIKRVFIGFAALKEGFMAGCKPFLGFDGCHLKGPYGGVLLSAIGIDGNNGLVPVANAIVESENYDSWCFFFQHLSDLMDGFQEDREWTFMSDRQKGLTEALLQKIPHGIHRKCSHHIFSNFKVKFPSIQLRSLFWAAAKSYTESRYKKNMELIRKLKPEAYDWLNEIGASKWARHAFSTDLKCDHVTNNISESYNSWVGKFRNQPVITMFENIRRRLMSKIQNRFAKAVGWTHEMTPNVLSALRKAALDCRSLTYWRSQGCTYEVKDGDITYIVRTDDRHCDCMEWDHTGIPCKHAAVVILGNRDKLVLYCDRSLTKDRYLKVYSSVMDPIPHQNFWPEMEDIPAKPPLLRRRVGRPTVARRRGSGEPPASGKRSFILKCGRCGVAGHNKRSCAGGPVKKRNRDKNRENQQIRKGNATSGNATSGNATSRNATQAPPSSSTISTPYGLKKKWWL